MLTNMQAGIDFVSRYPYGVDLTPQIEVLTGSYKGLIIDLLSSVIVSTGAEDKLVYDYRIISAWDNAPCEDNITVLTGDDQEFLSLLVLHYIDDQRVKNTTFELKIEE